MPEDYHQGTKFESWTDRSTGTIHLRAEPQESAPDNENVEFVELAFTYYTDTEQVMPRHHEFLPMWAVDAFERHGYEVVVPTDDGETPDDVDDDIRTDGGGNEKTRKFTIEASVTFETPSGKERTMTLTNDYESTDEDDAINMARDDVKDLVPKGGLLLNTTVNPNGGGLQ